VSDLVQVLLLTTMAGAAIPIGGAVARFEKIRHQLEAAEFECRQVSL
jgi:zinc transporter, ZIP family